MPRTGPVERWGEFSPLSTDWPGPIPVRPPRICCEGRCHEISFRRSRKPFVPDEQKCGLHVTHPCLLVVQHWTDRISLGNRLQGKQKDRATYEASVRRFGRDVCHRKLRQCIHRNGRRVLPAGRLRSMAFTSVATWELTGKTLTGATSI